MRPDGVLIMLGAFALTGVTRFILLPRWRGIVRFLVWPSAMRQLIAPSERATRAIMKIVNGFDI
jgi:hypothetical protein